jgi:hypothetical protein
MHVVRYYEILQLDFRRKLPYVQGVPKKFQKRISAT